MTIRLHEAIDNLYDVFSQYAKPNRIESCPCCLNDLEKTVMLTTDLGELSIADLRSYASDVFYTVGTIKDFRYFLPRILEITVTSDFMYPDPEIVLKKLALADWLNWPEADKSAALAVIDAKFEELLNATDRDILKLDSWICAIGRCVETITPYLDRLLEAGREEDLMAYVNENLSAFTKRKLSNGFWEKGSRNEQLTLEWFQNDRITVLVYVTYGMVI
jgi:hypothetical protein